MHFSTLRNVGVLAALSKKMYRCCVPSSSGMVEAKPKEMKMYATKEAISAYEVRILRHSLIEKARGLQ